MSTYYKDLPAQEILDTILDDIIANDRVSAERRVEEIKNIFDENFCIKCGFIRYNCVCSHED